MSAYHFSITRRHILQWETELKCLYSYTDALSFSIPEINNLICALLFQKKTPQTTPNTTETYKQTQNPSPSPQKLHAIICICLMVIPAGFAS